MTDPAMFSVIQAPKLFEGGAERLRQLIPADGAFVHDQSVRPYG